MTNTEVSHKNSIHSFIHEQVFRPENTSSFNRIFLLYLRIMHCNVRNGRCDYCFRVLIVVVVTAAAVVVLDSYWPHRPGRKFINPGKKSQSTQSLVSRYITYVPLYEVWNYQRTPKLHRLACLKSSTTAQE